MRKRFLRFLEVLLGAILLMVSVPVVVQAMADAENVAIIGEANAGDGGVAINEANFPDSKFRSYISYYYDHDEDGILGRDEIEDVTSIDLNDYDLYGVKDLTGICNFSYLESLHCGYEPLLKPLDVSGCAALKVLICSSTQLISLDVSGCAALKSLVCENNQLTELDVSGCAALEYLDCIGNPLTTLNTSGCSVLEGLTFDSTQLTTLNVSGCSALTSLCLRSSQLETLDVSGCAALKTLDCRDTELITLDVSGCAALKTLWCYYNSKLTTLDVSGCTALTSLGCSGSQLKALDVSSCAALEHFDCFSNQLKALDLSGCPALKSLSCADNQLTTLDTSGCASLEFLNCVNNQLTTLDLSKNEVLSNMIKNGDEETLSDRFRIWRVDVAGLCFSVDRNIKVKLSDGTVIGPFTPAATLNAKDITATASPSKAQSFKIAYTYDGDGTVSFKSDNAKVTVDASGKVTVAKNFAGKATIKISAPATKKFQAASTTITVTVGQIANTITANAVTKSSAASAQSFTLSVKQKGTGKLSYKSDNKSVKVTSTGKVTIAKNFSGRATITVKAAAAGGYKAASKNVVITVNPAAVTVSPAKNLAGQKVSLTWKKAPGAGGYQIQYSTSKNFSNKKSITAKSADTLKATLTKLTKGKTYYIRIRAYKKDAAGNLFSAWKSFKAVKVTK